MIVDSSRWRCTAPLHRHHLGARLTRHIDDAVASPRNAVRRRGFGWSHDGEIVGGHRVVHGEHLADRQRRAGPPGDRVCGGGDGETGTAHRRVAGDRSIEGINRYIVNGCRAAYVPQHEWHRRGQDRRRLDDGCPLRDVVRTNRVHPGDHRRSILGDVIAATLGGGFAGRGTIRDRVSCGTRHSHAGDRPGYKRCSDEDSQDQRDGTQRTHGAADPSESAFRARLEREETNATGCSRADGPRLHAHHAVPPSSRRLPCPSMHCRPSFPALECPAHTLTFHITSSSTTVRGAGAVLNAPNGTFPAVSAQSLACRSSHGAR